MVEPVQHDLQEDLLALYSTQHDKYQEKLENMEENIHNTLEKMPQNIVIDINRDKDDCSSYWKCLKDHTVRNNEAVINT